MTSWAQLHAELDLWAPDGVTLWWRDDDAIAAGPELRKLLSCASGTPIALAVIPARLDAGLALALDGANVLVVQHGYSHANHAPPESAKMELGAHRPYSHTLGDLATGWARLESVFGARARPILVPPWNRIAPAMVPFLPEIGYRGLSTFGARRRAEPIRGFVQTNTHVDIMDWRGARGFVGEEQALGALVGHLAARRTATTDDEPTGLLTHHLIHDEAAWAFLARLCEKMRDHPSARWLDADEAFRSGVGARTGAPK
ncbi:MAG: polysaccharide deacetylase family protein [Alphaproteobacteria bacterium]